MTKLTSRRWAIIFFISLALNVFLGGLFIADKYFKDKRGRSFHGMTYSVPWARRILGDEVRPMAREIFREHRESFRGTRRARAELYRKVMTVLAAEPFDKAAFRTALSALQENLQIGQTAMHSMMTEFSAKLTADQRKKLVQEVTRMQEKRQERRERRRKRRQERERTK
jgi:uncharacterized membrane protein